VRTLSVGLLCAILAGCGVAPEATSQHVISPATSPTIADTTAAAVAPTLAADGSPTPPDMAYPTDPAPPPPAITDQIDIPELLSRTTCSGGAFGGEYSLEIWTLRCRDSGESASTIAEGIQAELSNIGAMIEEEGSIISHNPETDGDTFLSMHFVMDDLRVIVRVYMLPTGSDASAVVVTIDQARTWPYWANN
jgi:hypothetical protein